MLLLFHMLKSKQRPNLAVSLQLDFYACTAHSFAQHIATRTEVPMP